MLGRRQRDEAMLIWCGTGQGQLSGQGQRKDIQQGILLVKQQVSCPPEKSVEPIPTATRKCSQRAVHLRGS